MVATLKIVQLVLKCHRTALVFRGLVYTRNKFVSLRFQSG